MERVKQWVGVYGVVFNSTGIVSVLKLVVLLLRDGC